MNSYVKRIAVLSKLVKKPEYYPALEEFVKHKHPNSEEQYKKAFRDFYTKNFGKFKQLRDWGSGDEFANDIWEDGWDG